MSLEFFGLDETATDDDVISAYKSKAKLAHPDRGGTAEQFQQLKEARDKAIQEISFGKSLSKARIQLDALRSAARGARCPRCDGTGKGMTMARGFRTFSTVCRLCKGKGHL